MTICHETASGQKNTLILPRTAALNHLLRHPNDTLGECSNGIVKTALRADEFNEKNKK